MSISSFINEKIAPYIGEKNTGGKSLIDLPGMIYQTKANQPPVTTNTNGVNATQPPSGDKTLNVLASKNKVQTTTPTSFDKTVQERQIALNKQNAGQPGWTALKTDGILGPKTKAAETWKPLNTPISSNPTDFKLDNTPTTPQTQTTDTSREGILTTLVKKGTTTGGEYQNINDLLTKKREELKNLDIAINKQEGAIETQPGLLNVQQGYLGAQQRLNATTREKLAEEITGLTNQLGAANTQQQTQTGAIQNALGQQSPVQVSPGNTMVSPSGERIYGMSGQSGNGASDYQAWQNAQANTGAGIDYAMQAQAMVPQINTLSNTFNQLKPLIAGVNTSDANGLNTARQALLAQGDASKLAAFDGAYAAFSNSIEALVNGLGGEQAISSIPGAIASLTALRNKSLSVDGMQNLYNQIYKASAQKANELNRQGKTFSGAGTRNPSDLPLGINNQVASNTTSTNNPFSSDNFFKS